MLYKRVKSGFLEWGLNIFFTVMIIELVLGGGGRFLEVGPLTVRMILYFTAIPISFVYLSIKRRINPAVTYWTICFTLLLMFSTFVGVSSGASIANIFEDIKPLTFFLILPFLALCIKTKEDVDYTLKLIKYSSLFLALIYILLVLLIVSGIIPFMKFYSYITPFGEVSFRNKTLFFYKGFLYLCVGFFFFLVRPGKWNKLAAVIMLLSVFLTLTRGFILTTLLTTLIYFIFIVRNKLIGLSALIISLIALGFALPFYLKTIGDKSGSDMVRYISIDQVKDKTTVVNLFIGDGFGVGVPIRPGHMEISYLEIFSKQGIVGLLFWILLFLHIAYLYFSLYKEKELFISYSPLFLSVLFIFLQSGTNPFLNNPIGLSMVLISFVCLLRVNSKNFNHIPK